LLSKCHLNCAQAILDCLEALRERARLSSLPDVSYMSYPAVSGSDQVTDFGSILSSVELDAGSSNRPAAGRIPNRDWSARTAHAAGTARVCPLNSRSVAVPVAEAQECFVRADEADLTGVTISRASLPEMSGEDGEAEDLDATLTYLLQIDANLLQVEL